MIPAQVQHQLKERVLDNIEGGRQQFIAIILVILGYVIVTAIGAIIATIASDWWRKHCENRVRESFRNPGLIARNRIRRAIKKGCEYACSLPDVRAEGYTDANAVYEEYGDRVFNAFLKTGQHMSDSEIDSLIKNA